MKIFLKLTAMPLRGEANRDVYYNRPSKATVIASPDAKFRQISTVTFGAKQTGTCITIASPRYPHFEALCTSASSFFSLTYGIVNQKIDPSPFFEVTQILPPSKPTKALHIESPSPVPAYCLDTALST